MLFGSIGWWKFTSLLVWLTLYSSCAVTIEKDASAPTKTRLLRHELDKDVRANSFKASQISVSTVSSGTPLADNSEPHTPEPGDFEQVAEVPDVLSEAGQGQFHGLLGLGEDGQPMIKPTSYPNVTTNEFLTTSAKGFGFNSFRSSAKSVDRRQSDYRSKQCLELAKTYPTDKLPAATVVMVFHNEHFPTLLRSLHSVLNLTPHNLLKEIVLVDDASKAELEFHEKNLALLGKPLEDYCKRLPKVRLVRLKRRRGLMLARMEGAWRARGEALIFLDSHIETTPGWAEPLLARIQEDRRHVVVPAIDGISSDDFSYLPKAGLGILGFTWTLGQDPMAGPTDDPAPVKSPIMAGGLFAADRAYFLHLGGYDQGMELYGGEEMEIGFRTWMCGGTIELMPCSHVGHIFRSGKYWQGQVYRVPGELVSKNKLRAAEVWMDKYKDLVKLATMDISDIGSVESRRQLRDKLKCNSFDWYLQNVYPSLHVPKYSSQSPKGSLENEFLHACVDSLQGRHIGEEFGAYPCHNQHGSQALLMDDNGYIMHALTKFEACLGTHSDGRYEFQRCDSPRAKWAYNSTSGTLRQTSSGRCMSVLHESGNLSPYKLTLEPCTDGRKEQLWKWHA